jgi:hypothetical protein
MGVGVMRDYKLKLRELNLSHTLGYTGKTYIITYWSRRRRHKTWSDAQETKGPESI